MVYVSQMLWLCGIACPHIRSSRRAQRYCRSGDMLDTNTKLPEHPNAEDYALKDTTVHYEQAHYSSFPLVAS